MTIKRIDQFFFIIMDRSKVIHGSSPVLKKYNLCASKRKVLAHHSIHVSKYVHLPLQFISLSAKRLKNSEWGFPFKISKQLHSQLVFLPLINNLIPDLAISLGTS